MQYYLLRVVGDVEPELHGPFEAPLLRDREAIRFRMRHDDEDGLYRLDLNARCQLQINSFVGYDFIVVDNWRDVERQAEAEGWTIFERDTPNEHGELFEIQRIDDPEDGHAKLENDVEAWRTVRANILHAGDSPSHRAYRLLAELSPKTAYALLCGHYERASV